MAFDLTKFNKETYTVLTETVAQNVAALNEQSGGAIQLIAKPFRGDFDVEASFKAMAGLVRRRDVNNGQNAISSARLQHHNKTAVKVASGTPEILWESAQYKWVQQDPSLAAITIGEQLAKATVADMLNAGIRCGVAAIKSNTAVVSDATSAVIDFKAMTKAAQLFGDRSSAIRAWVMHSGAVTGLYLNALSNNERLFTYENVVVYRDPFGRVIIVTDSNDLTFDKSGTRYNTLGLTEGGITVSSQNDFNSVIVPKTGKENITNAYQAEWSYGVSVKGYGWKVSSGGSNPNDTALATSTNWEKVATSHKDTAGVLLQSQ